MVVDQRGQLGAGSLPHRQHGQPDHAGQLIVDAVQRCPGEVEAEMGQQQVDTRDGAGWLWVIGGDVRRLFDRPCRIGQGTRGTGGTSPIYKGFFGSSV